MQKLVQPITPELIESLVTKARQSPRRRINYNFHQSMEENPHRFLNVMLRGTYIRPHRHLDPPKAETFLVLDGRVAFCEFDDEGVLLNSLVLGKGGLPGVDLSPGVWHSLVVLSESAVCFEIKPGPWRAEDDKEFALWAPPESTLEAEAYLNQLTEQLCRV